MSYGQEITVNTLQEKPYYELTGSELKKDSNGSTCAMINVFFEEENASFEGSYVVDNSVVGNSYQVFLAGGASKMVVKHADYLPLTILFADYGVKKLESGKVYDLKLIADKSKDALSKTVASEDVEALANAGDAEAQYKLGKFYYMGLNKDLDYGQAVAWFEKSMNQGNINAMYSLGLCYLYGQGVERDYDTSVKYLKEAAEKGHIMAQFKYANCMFLGNDGQGKNVDEAIIWYEKAASGGLIIAKNNVAVIYASYDPTGYNMGTSDVNRIGYPQFYGRAFDYLKECEAAGICEAYLNIGNMYSAGIGVEMDSKMALDYYMKAIENGYYPAYNNVAKCYFSGIGVKQNAKKAFEYFNIVSQKGIAAGSYGVALCYQTGKGARKNMKQAAYYYQKSADQGCAFAETNLGNLYENGLGVDKDLEKAYNLYLKAAQDGDPNGYANIGSMYHKGLYVSQDMDKALEYYTKAADLAILYQTGSGVPVDGEKAVSYYERACQIDHTGNANYNLGTLYQMGCGSVARDYKKAYEQYKTAAIKNYAPAQYNLGIMYIQGQYVNKDENMALHYIEKAAKQNFQPAKEFMHKLELMRMQSSSQQSGSNFQEQNEVANKIANKVGNALNGLFGK